MSKPFLKWAGGKYRLIPHLSPHFMKGTVLAEAFAGAASLTLNVEKDLYLLNDINSDLIGCYESLKDYQGDFVEYVGSLFTKENNTQAKYLDIREEFNNTTCLIHRSALFIYLNRHGYNGLCRYNGKGIYNVPYGRYAAPYFPAQEMFDFIVKSDRVLLSAEAHDVFMPRLMKERYGSELTVYCDPPYLPINESAFTEYSGKKFTNLDQIKLTNLAVNLAALGSDVVVSNHDTPYSRELYNSAELNFLSVARTISCKAGERRRANEVIAVFRASTPKVFRLSA